MTAARQTAAPDIVAVRTVLLAGHSLFGVLCGFHRPYLFELFSPYAGLSHVMPTRYWGLWALVVVAAILFTRQRPGLQLVAQMGSGLLLITITIAVTSVIGVNLSSVNYMVMATASLWSFYRYLDIFLDHSPRFQRFRSRFGRQL
jgi:hypothetical protein